MGQQDSKSTVHDADSDPMLTRLLCRWVDACQQRAWLTVTVVLFLTAGLGAYATQNLRLNMDPNAMFSKDLRFQKMIAEFSRYFPNLTDSLLIVIDGGTPETSRWAQQALAEALAKSDQFHRVFLPGEEAFFERTGLLYASVDEVDDFADSMALLQPVIGELSHSPTLPTMTRMIRLGIEGLETGATDTQRWLDVLDFVREAATSATNNHPNAVSWESLLLADSGVGSFELRLIVADPVLDLGRILSADLAIAAVHEAVERLNLGPDSGVRVRITGYPALNNEEMLGLIRDTALAGALSFAFVVTMLSVAFRSFRMVLAAAITLIIGLVWSAAITAVTVTELNPMSITFGVLVIGLGVDFIIHLGMHFADELQTQGEVSRATQAAVRSTGPALALCAATTAVGFLAFVPTEYMGVSDLGLAASGGILAILIQTLSLLPALLAILLPDRAIVSLRARVPRHRSVMPRLSPVPVCIGAAALGAGAAWLAPLVDLDTNVIRMRNPNTQSVEAFQDLLDSPATPWFVDALVPSLDVADQLAERMRALDVVDRAVTLTDFVPADQQEKLEVLADVEMLLEIPRATPRPSVPPSEQIAALVSLKEFLEAEPALRGNSPLARSARLLHDAIGDLLAVVERDGHHALMELERSLLDPLPGLFDRLRESLVVGEIDMADLPPGLQSRMVSTEGKARIQIYPTGDLWEHDQMVTFVEAIRSIWEDISGLPVNLVESARITWTSLIEAMAWAFVAISTLLLLMWRRVGDAALALGPLLFAVLLTQASTAVLPISFNFANVIVLPLILGIGIDSAVHLVHRERTNADSSEPLLQSTTARAVLFSAITTIASFGTLGISSHRGAASLGYLLGIGMIFTLCANLVLLPALMALRARRRAASAGLER